jgi:hypothetical protein
MGITFLPCQPQIDRYLRVLFRFEFSLANLFLQREKCPLLHVEIDVHWVNRDDRRQHRLVGIHQVSQAELAAADFAGDRRADLREEHIQSRAVALGFSSENGRVRLLFCRLCLVVHLSRDRILLLQRNCPLEVGTGFDLLRHGSCQLRQGGVQIGLKLAVVDLVQRLIFSDFRTVLEQDLGEKAGDPRSNIDRLGRVGPAGVFDVIDDRFLHRRTHNHNRCRWLGITIRVRFVAASQGTNRERAQEINCAARQVLHRCTIPQCFDSETRQSKTDMKTAAAYPGGENDFSERIHPHTGQSTEGKDADAPGQVQTRRAESLMGTKEKRETIGPEWKRAN